jgi:hypothetical protein
MLSLCDMVDLNISDVVFRFLIGSDHMMSKYIIMVTILWSMTHSLQ